MHEIKLAGCSPTPLANYLKALGILRLVAVQRDETALGYWAGETFVLSTQLAIEELENFFLNAYRPTPVIAPWNGGSGFYPKDNKGGIGSISASKCQRLQEYREAITLGQHALEMMSLHESPKDKQQKNNLLTFLRAELPEIALNWLDAAVLLTDDDPKYPPLLGTGGNDGRLDFTNNFMQRLVELFDPEKGMANIAAQQWLQGAMLGGPVPQLLAKAIGQFAPGGVGGPNASTGFEGGSLMNPWDFIFMIEGALPFAAAATRRMEAVGNLALSYPFTVQPTGSGSGGASFTDETNARAEMWLPLWRVPANYGEIRALLSEGRVTLGRRPVRDGLEFSRAIAALGMDRGIDTFQRVGFFMRSGKAYLATPLNRFEVRQNRQVGLIAELDKAGWLNRLRFVSRRDEMPARLKSLVRQFEDAIFALSQRTNITLYLQKILILLGEVQILCGESPKVREALKTPVPRLTGQWVIQADDGSVEFRLAVALAGICGIENQKRLTMRMFIAPVATDGQTWCDASRSVVWAKGDVTRNLINVLQRLLLESAQLGFTDKPLRSQSYCTLNDVAAFINREVDDQKIVQLLAGLVLVDIPKQAGGSEKQQALLPAVYALLKPLFTPDSALKEINFLHQEQHLPIPPGLLRRLTSPSTFDSGLQLANRRLQASGMLGMVRTPAFHGVDVRRLTASLLIPVNYNALNTLLDTIGITPQQPASQSAH